MAKKIAEKVDFKILIRAKPEQAYDAIATSSGLDGWFTTNSTVEARPGGKMVMRWQNWGPDHYTGENGGPVLEAKRPERFVFQWKVDTDDYNTTVEIDFKPVAEGTEVRLTECCYDDTPSGLKDLLSRASGWGEALTLMKFYVEHGVKY